MSRRGLDLAARFRGALDTAEAEARRAEQERQRVLERARAARAEVLDDLKAVGDAIGHLAVQRDDAGVLTFRYGDRFLAFEPQGEGDRVKVSFTGTADDEEHRMYREPALGDRWVWSLRRRGREDRLPLFDAGLEELLVLALKLPRPELAAPASAASLDDLVPGADEDRKRLL